MLKIYLGHNRLWYFRKTEMSNPDFIALLDDLKPEWSNLFVNGRKLEPWQLNKLEEGKEYEIEFVFR